jgi:hypothetical protein
MHVRTHTFEYSDCLMDDMTACFLGALQAQARTLGKPDAVKNATVHAQVHIGAPEKLNGFGIAVDIKVEGVEDDEVIAAGHEVSRTLIDLSPVSHISTVLPLQSGSQAWSSCQCFQGLTVMTLRPARRCNLNP